MLRERVRRDRETFELPAGADVGGARGALSARHPQIAALLPRVQTAVNRVIVGGDKLLEDGDELALIPPVAGGAGARGRKVAVVGEPLDVGAVIAVVEGPERGGLVTFSGI